MANRHTPCQRPPVVRRPLASRALTDTAHPSDVAYSSSAHHIKNITRVLGQGIGLWRRKVVPRSAYCSRDPTLASTRSAPGVLGQYRTPPSDAIHPHNQIQETACLVNNVLKLRFLVLDFGVWDSAVQPIAVLDVAQQRRITGKEMALPGCRRACSTRGLSNQPFSLTVSAATLRRYRTRRSRSIGSFLSEVSYDIQVPDIAEGTFREELCQYRTWHKGTLQLKSSGRSMLRTWRMH
eukprot:2537120-Rhodomonas_salina.2